MINPCCPTRISLRKLIKPIQITGVTSTPPIVGINFFVKFRIGLEGIDTINQNPLFIFIFGYHVRISLTRKIKVNNDKSKPNAKSIIGR